MQNDSLLVNRKMIFEEIALLMSVREKQKFVCKERECMEAWHDDRDFCGNWGSNILRTYYIVSENNVELFAHTEAKKSIFVGEKSGEVKVVEGDIDRLVSYDEIKEYFYSFLDSYPYFSDFFESFLDNLDSKKTENKVKCLVKK